MNALQRWIAVRSTREQSAWAVLAACGLSLLGPAEGVPTVIRGLALLAFILVGPGLAITAWTRLSGIVLAAVVPVIGLSEVIGLTTVSAYAGWRSTGGMLTVLAGLSAASALAALWSARRTTRLDMKVA